MDVLKLIAGVHRQTWKKSCWHCQHVLTSSVHLPLLAVTLCSALFPAADFSREIGKRLMKTMQMKYYNALFLGLSINYSFVQEIASLLHIAKNARTDLWERRVPSPKSMGCPRICTKEGWRKSLGLRKLVPTSLVSQHMCSTPSCPATRQNWDPVRRVLSLTGTESHRKIHCIFVKMYMKESLSNVCCT